MAKTRRALVLSGGGSRGAYQAGAWAALREAGWQPDVVAGTSVGAINGALIVAGAEIEEMRTWWFRLRTKDLFEPRMDVWRAASWDSLKRPRRLRALLEKHLDMDAMRAGKARFFVTAVDLEQGCHVIWEKEDLTVEHIMATTALIPGLPPVEIAGRTYIDGGHWTPLPVLPAVETGARDVVCVLHAPEDPAEAPIPQGLRALIRRVTDIRVVSRELADLAQVRYRMRLPRGHPARLGPVDLRVIAPREPFTTDILEFSPESARRMWRQGEEDARAVLAAKEADGR